MNFADSAAALKAFDIPVNEFFTGTANHVTRRQCHGITNDNPRTRRINSKSSRSGAHGDRAGAVANSSRIAVNPNLP